MNTQMINRPLTGQRAIVTGGNSGIGAAVAEGLANAGAKVMINYVAHPEMAESLAERIRSNNGIAVFFKPMSARKTKCKPCLKLVARNGAAWTF